MEITDLTQLAMSWIPVRSEEVGEDEDMATKNKKINEQKISKKVFC